MLLLHDQIHIKLVYVENQNLILYITFCISHIIIFCDNLLIEAIQEVKNHKDTIFMQKFIKPLRFHCAYKTTLLMLNHIQPKIWYEACIAMAMIKVQHLNILVQLSPVQKLLQTQ